MRLAATVIIASVKATAGLTQGTALWEAPQTGTEYF